MDPGSEGPAKIFRTQALHSVGGRNRLNTLSPMISPQIWVVTAALALLLAAVVSWGFLGRIPVSVIGSGVFLRGERLDSIHAPLEGMIYEFKKHAGDRVKARECIALIARSAAEVEQPAQVLASADGTIVSIEAEDWDFVTQGQTIAIVAAGSDDPICIAFVPLAEGKRLVQGMQVRASFSHSDSYGDARAIGTVSSIDDFVTGPGQMLGRIPSPTVIESIQERFGTITAIVVAFERDPNGRDGLRWTTRRGASGAVANGTPCDVEIIVSEIPPAALLLPGLGQGDGSSP
ncbi:MAG: HlyD family efflux transporter periplasmic adaptor subunit [Phycisphaerales bacterium]|nr:HlyD family efflux transporter periplasmic adaptor subunit [Phycisphaerales bacterium]